MACGECIGEPPTHLPITGNDFLSCSSYTQTFDLQLHSKPALIRLQIPSPLSYPAAQTPT